MLKKRQEDERKKGIYCSKCGNKNVNISVETFGEKTKTKEEIVKKGIIERTGNSLGRAGMIVATRGLWAATPKKAKYRGISSGQTTYSQKKIAICQNCGNSWEV